MRYQWFNDGAGRLSLMTPPETTGSFSDAEDAPEVSVVVPIYNEAGNIVLTLAAVRSERAASPRDRVGVRAPARACISIIGR